MNGLNKFIDTNPGVKIKVNLYGNKGNIKILKRISTVNPELINYFNLSPRMTQEEVIKKLNNSHVLLLLASKKHVALPAKLFEYFGLEKMIIVSTNDKSDVETFVNATNSGFVCDNSDEIYENTFIVKKQKHCNFCGDLLPYPSKFSFSRKCR